MTLGLSNITNTYLQNSSWRQNKVPSQNNDVSFSRVFSSQDASVSRVDEYKKHLESKYGTITIQSVGKDQASLDKIGAGMTGRDVVIAQNILEAMAADSQKASYYEGKIDYFWGKIPEYTASFAARGLAFEPGGVVIHEDGTVTYISGCSDSPERVAQVEAENKARQEKAEEQRKKLLERSQEESMKQRQLIELYMQKQLMVAAHDKRTSATEDIADSDTSNLMAYASAPHSINTSQLYEHLEIVPERSGLLGDYAIETNSI